MMQPSSIFKKVFLLGFCLSSLAMSATPSEILQQYMEQAKKDAPTSSQDFSAENGKKLYLTEVVQKNGEKMSCTSCHTQDPKAIGKSKVGKEIKPLAPVANSKRFTDSAKVEKWFKRNCKDVLERPCTTLEKGDFLSYMIQVK